ncbi:hypothetical protein GF406_10115 [candidate division KSB1 bacterium]|nr:hypothetical protein [candidate division KSB1 bacterium]
MLADSSSRIIREFGILNENIEPGSKAYGIPHPGLYVIDENLIVIEKQFQAAYDERPSGESILAVHFDKSLPHQKQFKLPYLKGSVAIADTTSYPSQMHAVQIKFQLDPGIHVYGHPVPQGYVPLTITLQTLADVSMDSIEVPPTRSYHIESLDETFNVLPAEFTLQTYLRTVKKPQAGDFELIFKIEMQACDNRVCFPPEEKMVRFPFHISRALKEQTRK